MSDTFTISQLAAEFGVTPRALRFYEDRGLLAPARRGQARLYSRRDRARLALILRGKRVGFSLTEIAEMLNLYDLEDGQETQLRTALGKFRAQIAALEAQRRDIEESIAELHRACDFIETSLSERRERVVGRPVIGYAVMPTDRV
ncbi:MAG: MerR family DNA-binding transcriptional regulator [Alphaproteobacteria bacterium]|nr:MerR family DNA-binding transcriptional regulator [Alphaproteobacteria bacterium]